MSYKRTQIDNSMKSEKKDTETKWEVQQKDRNHKKRTKMKFWSWRIQWRKWKLQYRASRADLINRKIYELKDKSFQTAQRRKKNEEK